VRPVMFVSDLPHCCRLSPLRLPRPTSVVHVVQGGMDVDDTWDLGLNSWNLTVGVDWDQDDPVLPEAIGAHLQLRNPTWRQVLDALADHGIDHSGEEPAWVGTQQLVTANLHSDLNRAAGRKYLGSGQALFNAADAQANDLNELVGPIVSLDDPDTMWSQATLNAFGDADGADLAILLRSVRISPIVRGHHLGAWAAAQSVALFDHGRTLVATMAAPLARQDGVPGFADHHQGFTESEQALWDAEQKRLAGHWATYLGFTPLESDRNILVWYSGYTNDALDAALGLWR